MSKIIQSSFARGEIGPALYGRVDLRQYSIALRRARNMVVHQFGGVSNKPGTRFVGPVKDHTATPRLVSFEFKTTDTHILEFGNLYMRVIRNDAHVTESTFAISAITKADPCVVTTATHSYSNGDEVFLTGIVGMTELNNRRFVIANITSTTFELTDQFTGTDIDSTGFTTYSSAGTSARVFTLVTPYTTAQLRDLDFVQTADIMTIVHPDHDPRELARLAVNNWTLTTITFRPGITFPTTLGVSGGTGSATSYKVTAIADNNEESLAGLGSPPGQISITAITQANPAVVTVTAHGWSNGDRIHIDSVVGMTELNDRRFVVANKATNTIELLGEDSSGYTAYSSAGTVFSTFADSANDTAVALTWTAVAGAVRYRIFKKDQGVYGFIAGTEANAFTDDGTITPDAGDTPPILVEPFVGTDNRPGAVGFYQQRRVFGGSNNNPDTSFYSFVGSFNNFSNSVPI